MSSAVLKGNSSGSGVITIETPNTNSNFTISLPAATGTMMVSGNMPAFRAFQTNDQTMASGDTAYLCQLGSETFDTASCFNNTGSTVNGIPAYAFLPNVAGYYQVNGKAYLNKSGGSVYGIAQIFKNGTTHSIGSYLFSVSAADMQSLVSDVIYLNGTTDYIQLYAQAGAASTLIKASSVFTYFSASLVRAA